MDSPNLVWTTVFADAPAGGNPCPVVFGADGWPAEQMQSMAAGFGAETAFVLEPCAGGDVRLRYFVPRHEMEMCVHATVAAGVLLGRSGRLPRSPAKVETPLGIIDVAWDAEASAATVAQFAPTFGDPIAPSARARLLAALGLTTAALAPEVGPVCSVSTARAKLLIPLRDEAVLDGITLAADALWELCDDLEVTGAFPFTLQASGADVAARQFPARAGYDEDPATGVAAAALAAYLAVHTEAGAGWRAWRIAQGRAMGRPSLLTAEACRDERGTVTATRVGGVMRELAAEPERL